MILTDISNSWDYPAEKSACFTGHRPEKISNSLEIETVPPIIIKNFLSEQIESAIKNGISLFYTGLARGIDLWAAEIVLDFSKKYNNICLIGVQPFPNFKHIKSSELFQKICDNADFVLTVSNYFYKGVFLERDRFMVDHSSLLIGVYNSLQKDSGSFYTVQYAKQKNLETKLLDLKNIEI